MNIFKCKPQEVHFTITNRVPYNKLLTNLACLSRTGEYWPSVVFVRTLLRSVRTATTSGQYSPVRPSRSVSKRLVLCFEISFLCYTLPLPQVQVTLRKYGALPWRLVKDKYLQIRINELRVRFPLEQGSVQYHVFFFFGIIFAVLLKNSGLDET